MPHRSALTIAAMLLCAAAPLGGPLVMQASGVQIYACQAGLAWHLQSPEATLTDASGHTTIHHFAGPSWQAADGSMVVGEMLATSPGAVGSIPWVVLQARAHRGAGLLAVVAFIVRSNTQGGLAPSGGCDKDHAGALARVPYHATYTFFGSS